jgi:hypothetical protein
MAGPTHGALTFRRVVFGGGGVYTVFFRTRDLGTTASCVANPAEQIPAEQIPAGKSCRANLR